MALKYNLMNPPKRDVLQKLCNAYFKEKVDDAHRAPSISGLCKYISISEKSLDELAKTEEYGDIIGEAILFVKEWVEQEIATRQTSTAGLQYIMDNRFGWAEKRVQETTVNAKFEATRALPMEDKIALLRAASEYITRWDNRLGAAKQPVEAENEESDAEPSESEVSDAN